MINDLNGGPMQRKRYTLTRTNITACLIIIAGTVFWVQGVICNYQLGYVKSSYTVSEIKNGRYIECDISREQLLGRNDSELSGELRYAPYSDTDIYTGVETYIVATNENPDSYIPITITREYQDDFDNMTSGFVSTYHMFGKFKRYTKFDDIFGETLSYDDVAQNLGIDEEEAENVISTDHKIVPVDPKAERRITFKGLSLILLGSLILYSSERMDGRGNNNYSFVRRIMASLRRRYD